MEGVSARGGVVPYEQNVRGCMGCFARRRVFEAAAGSPRPARRTVRRNNLFNFAPSAGIAVQNWLRVLVLVRRF